MTVFDQIVELAPPPESADPPDIAFSVMSERLGIVFPADYLADF